MDQRIVVVVRSLRGKGDHLICLLKTGRAVPMRHLVIVVVVVSEVEEVLHPEEMDGDGLLPVRCAVGSYRIDGLACLEEESC